MPKIICYFLEHPNEWTDYSSLCRNIGEDRGAGWKQMKSLVQAAFLNVERRESRPYYEGRPYYRLNQEFPLLNEFKTIMETERIF